MGIPCEGFRGALVPDQDDQLVPTQKNSVTLGSFAHVEVRAQKDNPLHSGHYAGVGCYRSGTHSVPAVHLCKSPPCGLPMEAGKCLESVRPYTQFLTRRNWGPIRPWRCGLGSNSPDRNSCFTHFGRASVSALPSVSSASSLSSRLISSPGCSRPAVARCFALFVLRLLSLPPPLAAASFSPLLPFPPLPRLRPAPRMLGDASFFARPSGSMQARICPAHMALT